MKKYLRTETNTCSTLSNLHYSAKLGKSADPRRFLLLLTLKSSFRFALSAERYWRQRRKFTVFDHRRAMAGRAAFWGWCGNICLRRMAGQFGVEALKQKDYILLSKERAVTLAISSKRTVRIKILSGSFVCALFN